MKRFAWAFYFTAANSVLAKRYVQSPSTFPSSLHLSHAPYYYRSFNQDKDTRLRMPNKWHISKDGQAANKKRQHFAHSIRHPISSVSLLKRLAIMPFDVTTSTGFSDLQATLLVCHLPEPKERS
jgi:hypothetical protein